MSFFFLAHPVYYNYYKLTDQNVVLYSSTTYYVHG